MEMKLRRALPLPPLSIAAQNALDDTLLVRTLNDAQTSEGERTSILWLAQRFDKIVLSHRERVLIEMALAAEHGAVLAKCEHGGEYFLTGPLTGRRLGSKYCSARCRVAAMRARKRAVA
jgi:hypothetical protein